MKNKSKKKKMIEKKNRCTHALIKPTEIERPLGNCRKVCARFAALLWVIKRMSISTIEQYLMIMITIKADNYRRKVYFILFCLIQYSLFPSLFFFFFLFLLNILEKKIARYNFGCHVKIFFCEFCIIEGWRTTSEE